MRAFALALVLAMIGCTRGDVLTTRQPPPTLDVSPRAVALAPGASRELAARVTGSAAQVLWSTSGGTIEGGDRLITYTAPLTQGAQTVTATLQSSPPISVTVTMTVSDQIVFGLAVPTDHPRLWWNAERLARARAWLESHPYTPQRDDPLGIALHALLSSQPGECGPAIAFALDLDVSVAPADTAQAEGETVILIYDWCHDAWSGEQRAVFTQRWNTLLSTVGANNWGGLTMPQNEVFWGRLRNHFEWGVASLGENAQAEGFLRDALDVRWRDTFVPHASSAGLGGGLQEGSFFGPKVLGAAVVPLVSAGLLGRDLFGETEFFNQAVYAVTAATTPAPTMLRETTSRAFELFPSNEDPGFVRGGSGQTQEVAHFMAAAADRYGTTTTGGVAQSWLNLTAAPLGRHVEAVSVSHAPTVLSTLPLDLFIEGPGWLLGRSSWSPASTTFQLQLGALTGVGHEHLDSGSFQLWRRGAWLSRESASYFERFTGYGGIGTTPAEGSLAHNVLLLDGKGLATPRPEGRPLLLRLESHPDWVFVAVDLTPAYRILASPGSPTDNPAVGHVERELIFLRAQETLVIFDRLTANPVGGMSADAVSKTFLMHFERQPVIEDARRVRMVQSDQAVRLTTLVPASFTQRVVDEGGSGQFRLELDAPGDAFLNVLQAGDASGAAEAVGLSATATAYEVTIGATRLVFERGATSVGGSVTLSGAPAHAWPSRAQSMRWGASDAPRWSPLP